MKNILARTFLKSHSGQKYIYEIYLQVDTDTGEVRFVSEKGEIFARPYMILILLEDVLDSMESPILHSGNVATLCYNKGGHKKNQASLETSTGRRYRLRQEIEGGWLNTIYSSSLLEMIRYFHQLRLQAGVSSDTIFLSNNIHSWYKPEWVWMEVTSWPKCRESTINYTFIVDFFYVKINIKYNV